MQFVITAYDGEGMLDRRLKVRSDHLENIARIRDRVLCAGGLLDDEGKMRGSVLIMEFDNRQQVDEYLKSEPYYTEHVWEKVAVEIMNVVLLDRKVAGK